MLFTESYLGTNPFSILDEGVYLTENESCTQPHTLPIKENSRLGINIINYSDIEKLSENYFINDISSLNLIIESNEISGPLVIAINEEDMILNPHLSNVFGMDNIVINPISTSDPIYTYCEAWCKELENDISLNERSYAQIAVDFAKQIPTISKQSWNLGKTPWGAYKKTGEEFDKNIGDFEASPYVTEEDKNDLKSLKKWTQRTHAALHPVTLGTAATVGIGGGILAYKKIKEYRNKPKSVIAKKIASLRSIYQKYMKSAQENPKKASIFKKICAKILQAIDTLLGYLQRKADGK